MNQEGAAFTYLLVKFPRQSEAKLEEDIFTGPQIPDIIKDEFYDKFPQSDETFAVLARYYWTLATDAPTMEYK